MIKKTWQAAVACALALVAQAAESGVTCTSGWTRGADAPARVLQAAVQRQAAWNAQYSGPTDNICVKKASLEPADWATYRPACEVVDGSPPFRPPVAFTESWIAGSSAENADLLQTYADNLARTGRLSPLLPASMPLPQKIVTYTYRPVIGLYPWTYSGRAGSPDGTLIGRESKLDDCFVYPTLIGFFNGVWNTDLAARDSLDRLSSEFGSSRGGVPIDYELFYNQTGCGDSSLTKINCIEDIFEVFSQRRRELDGVLANRWEFFWEMLAGRHRQEGSLGSRLLAALGNSSNTLLQLLDSTFNAMLGQLAGVTSRMVMNPPTMEQSSDHVALMRVYEERGTSMLLVAHSQGNLFVNAAYDTFRAQRPSASVQVVHVAPASPTLRGDYVLADIDIVINGLRVQGTNSVPAANLSLPFSSSDLSGHMLEATYLDRSRAGYDRVRNMITTALDKL